MMEVLESHVIAGLNGVKVLWTLTEQRVLPLMQRAHLLCDYTKAKNPTCDVMDDLEANIVKEWVIGLVGAGIVVVTRNAIEAF